MVFAHQENMIPSKQEILVICHSILKEKELNLEKELGEISASMEQETKSSAGDKHETARAHMQAREAQVKKQLAELNGQVSELERVNPLSPAGRTFTGSLVQTNKGFFFIAIALGKIKVQAIEVFVISPRSPMGKLLLGLENHAEFSLNGQMYRILKIC
jgi:hypothetical protein